jgi:hypothetical protein
VSGFWNFGYAQLGILASWAHTLISQAKCGLNFGKNGRPLPPFPKLGKAGLFHYETFLPSSNINILGIRFISNPILTDFVAARNAWEKGALRIKIPDKRSYSLRLP